MVKNRSSLLTKQVFSRNRSKCLPTRFVLITSGKGSIFTGRNVETPSPHDETGQHTGISTRM